MPSPLRPAAFASPAARARFRRRSGAGTARRPLCGEPSAVGAAPPMPLFAGPEVDDSPGRDERGDRPGRNGAGDPRQGIAPGPRPEGRATRSWRRCSRPVSRRSACRTPMSGKNVYRLAPCVPEAEIDPRSATSGTPSPRWRRARGRRAGGEARRFSVIGQNRCRDDGLPKSKPQLACVASSEESRKPPAPALHGRGPHARS